MFCFHLCICVFLVLAQNISAASLLDLWKDNSKPTVIRCQDHLSLVSYLNFPLPQDRYAAWLEGNGYAERAFFIRKVLEHQKLLAQQDPRHVAVEKEIDELLKTKGEAWLSEAERSWFISHGGLNSRSVQPHGLVRAQTERVTAENLLKDPDTYLGKDKASAVFGIEISGIQGNAHLQRIVELPGMKYVPVLILLGEYGNAHDGSEFARIIGTYLGNNLKVLNARGKFAKGAPLTGFRALSGLTELELIGEDVITDATLEDIAKHLTHLERLNLKFEIQPDYDGDIAYSHFTDKGLHHLGALDHLKELDLLLAGKFTDGAFTEIARIKGLRKIRVDSFQGTFTDVALEPLRNLLLLEDLNFSGISVSDAGLNLISGLLRLRELKLHGDKHSFTESGVRALLKIPHLTYLHVLGTKFASDKECERIELEFRARKPDGEFNIIDQFGFGARVGARP